MYEDEYERSNHVTSALNEVLGHTFAPFKNSDETDDSVVAFQPESTIEQVLLLLLADKGEMDASGCDPTAQGALSVRRWWSQRDVRTCTMCSSTY